MRLFSFIFIAFEPSIILTSFFIILILLFFDDLNGLPIAEYLRENGEMHIHELPCRPQNHTDALSAIVYEISENHGEAFECIPLDVEIFLGVTLNDLKKYGHPLIKGFIQAVLNQFVVNAICPADRSKAQVEDVQHLLPSMGPDLLIREGRKDRR
jgi:hypothetical protein